MSNTFISPSEVEAITPISSLRAGCYAIYDSNYNLFDSSVVYPINPLKSNNFYSVRDKLVNYYKSKGYSDVYFVDCMGKEVWKCVLSEIKNLNLPTSNSYEVCCFYRAGTSELNYPTAKYLFFLENYKTPVIKCPGTLTTFTIHDLNLNQQTLSFKATYTLNTPNTITLFFSLPYNFNYPLENIIIYLTPEVYLEYKSDYVKNYAFDFYGCEDFSDSGLKKIDKFGIYLKKAGNVYFTPNLILQKYDPLKPLSEGIKEVLNSASVKKITIDYPISLGVIIYPDEKSVRILTTKGNTYKIPVDIDNYYYSLPQDLDKKIKIAITLREVTDVFVFSVVPSFEDISLAGKYFLDLYNRLNQNYNQIEFLDKLAMITLMFSLANIIKNRVLDLIKSLESLKDLVSKVEEYCSTSISYCNNLQVSGGYIDSIILKIESYLYGQPSSLANLIIEKYDRYFQIPPDYVGLSLTTISAMVEDLNFAFFRKHQELLIQASDTIIKTLLSELEGILFDGSTFKLTYYINVIKKDVLDLANDIYETTLSQLTQLTTSEVEEAYESVVVGNLFSGVSEIELSLVGDKSFLAIKAQEK